MPIVRRVFGPFVFEETMPHTTMHELRWPFIIITGDREIKHVHLVFSVSERKFTVSYSQPRGTNLGRAMKAVSKEMPKGYPKGHIEHHDAFLDDRPVQEGRVADILRKYLRPEDHARCTAALIARR